MIFIISLILGADSLYSQSQLFLQQDSLSSLSTLSTGLESFSQDFSDFSKNLDVTLAEIENQLKALNSINEEVGLSVLNSDIIQLNNTIAEIDKKIEYVKAKLLENDECTILDSCSLCTKNPKCAWCDDNKKCEKGDKDGPLFSECKYFSYEKCNKKGCDKYLTCTTCISDHNCG